jgi:hypothetical protein
MKNHSKMHHITDHGTLNGIAGWGRLGVWGEATGFRAARGFGNNLKITQHLAAYAEKACLVEFYRSCSAVINCHRPQKRTGRLISPTIKVIQIAFPSLPLVFDI